MQLCYIYLFHVLVGNKVTTTYHSRFLCWYSNDHVIVHYELSNPEKHNWMFCANPQVINDWTATKQKNGESMCILWYTVYITGLLFRVRWWNNYMCCISLYIRVRWWNNYMRCISIYIRVRWWNNYMLCISLYIRVRWWNNYMRCISLYIRVRWWNNYMRCISLYIRVRWWNNYMCCISLYIINCMYYLKAALYIVAKYSPGMPGR